MESTIDLEATLSGRLDEVCDVLARQTCYPSQVQVDLGPTAVREQVDVVLGPLEVQDRSVTQSIHIEAADHRRFFPTLDGELFALELDGPGDTASASPAAVNRPLAPPAPSATCSADDVWPRWRCRQQLGSVTSPPGP